MWQCRKKTEITYNPALFCRRSLNEGQLSSQVVYLPGLTVVSLTRKCVGSWNRKACPVLCHIRLCHVWKELPLQLDVWHSSCERAHDPTDILFFNLYSILVNQSIEPFSVPTLSVLHLRLHPWAPASSLAQLGLKFTQERKSGPFNMNQSNQSWPHTAQSQRGAAGRDGYKAPSQRKPLLLLFVVLHLVEQQVIPLYKHVHFWAPSQVLKQ